MYDFWVKEAMQFIEGQQRHLFVLNMHA